MYFLDAISTSLKINSNFVFDCFLWYGSGNTGLEGGEREGEREREIGGEREGGL